MISGRDIGRILTGVSMIFDHSVSRNKGDVLVKLERARYHAQELMKVMLEMRNIPHDTHSTSSSATATATAAASSVPKDIDLTGFSSIPATDVSANAHMKQPSSMHDMNRKVMRESKVPATQFERLWNFGSLATRLAVGIASDNVSSMISPNNNSISGSGQRSSKRTISDTNAEVLADALCRMRGAALKLGQMLSLQDDDMLPPALSKALERVKQAADYMPRNQLEAQLSSQLGNNWRDMVKEFDDKPIAAASIGQVHKAVLLDGTIVAMKIQYPGVADSIESDLSNLKSLVTMTNILPPGLFIDQIIKVASTELAMECDYELEAKSQSRYRELILNDKVLNKYTSVPEIIPELSTKRVLTSKLVAGITIDKALDLPQPVRNAIARTVLIMTIRELFEWRFIQSDPNFGNFLYDDDKRIINLIDFGAAREYSKEFVDGYMKLVWAAANKDRATILQVSKDLNFLTGDETTEMIDAHIDAGLIVGEPFLSNESFDFANSKLTQRIGNYGEIFMKYRLTPPPTEAYSLHRKLAGAFLLAIKLKANIPCRDILESQYKKYAF